MTLNAVRSNFAILGGNKEPIRHSDITSLDHKLHNRQSSSNKFKFELNLGLAVICVAPTQFRSTLELNSV